MGVVATKAIQARRRSTDVRIDRLVAERDASDAGRSARNQRIKAATRDARKALRAKAAANRARETAEVRAGAAVRRLIDEGLTISDAAALLDLSRSAARRLHRLPTGPTEPVAAESSTESVDERAQGDLGAHGEDRSTATCGDTTEGNL